MLAITLAPPAGGLAAAVCAPRCVVVQCVLKTEANGIRMLLFDSLEPTEARRVLGSCRVERVHGACARMCVASPLWAFVLTVALLADCALWLPAGSLARSYECCCSLCPACWMTMASAYAHSLATGGAALPAGGGWGTRLWRPVLASVRGGYTVSGLEGFGGPGDDDDGNAPPESLVTCIVKADLGGWLAEGSWLHGLGSGAGVTDAFLERLLTAVILVRDDVEQQRFKVGGLGVLHPCGPRGGWGGGACLHWQVCSSSLAACQLDGHAQGGCVGCSHCPPICCTPPQSYPFALLEARTADEAAGEDEYMSAGEAVWQRFGSVPLGGVEKQSVLTVRLACVLCYCRLSSPCHATLL